MPQDPDSNTNRSTGQSPDKRQNTTSGRKPTLWQLTVSMMGAALGVQSSKVREKDFQSSSPTPYIIGGIVLGIVFVGGIALAVTLVLKNVGG
ncbi:MAG: DUF2970 domain-containing protein [Oleiphilaceae bacterium]|nr:DUF2970 domain-containing protein [Oleiphilaceae bacterium]